MDLDSGPGKKSVGQLTTSEEDKELLFKKLMANDLEGLRKMDLKSLDLNIFEPVENMEFVEEEVTPLIYCAFYGKTEMAKLLLENKFIDCDLETEHNKHTPLTVACLGSNYEMVKLLIAKGAEVNKPTALFQTPLIVTLLRLIEEICLKIAELLLLHQADPNWVFEKQKGFNMLHFLCNITTKMNQRQRQLNYSLIKFLVEKGANTRQRTLTDKKPVDLLAGHCNATEIKRLILEVEEKTLASNQPKAKLKKQLSLHNYIPQSNLCSQPEGQQYSRGEEIRWFKQNLLSIHGIVDRV